MIAATARVSPVTASRLAGALYLFTMATSVVSEMVVKANLVVDGNATATAANIMAARPLFRLGLACDLLTSVGVAALIWAVYLVLRPVNRDLALLGLSFRFVETAVGFGVICLNFVALRFLSSASYLTSIPAEQLHSLALVALNSRAVSLNVVFLLLGTGSTVFASLWLKSGFIPRWLALLGIVGSLLLSIYAFAMIVYPPIARFGIMPMLPLGVFEVTMGFWLLIGARRIGALSAATA